MITGFEGGFQKPIDFVRGIKLEERSKIDYGELDESCIYLVNDRLKRRRIYSWPGIVKLCKKAHSVAQNALEVRRVLGFIFPVVRICDVKVKRAEREEVVPGDLRTFVQDNSLRIAG